MPSRRYYVLQERVDNVTRWAVWVTVYPMPPKRAVPALTLANATQAERLSHALQEAFDQGVEHGRARGAAHDHPAQDAAHDRPQARGRGR